MSSAWTYRQWQPGGERAVFDDITFDSAIHCGAGHAFEQVGPSHYRCRSRTGLAPYSWRLHLGIESPGDGREITLEVADFNHAGQELWQEAAAVVSSDGEHWDDLGTDRIRIVPWTPTGVPADDDSLNDGSHPPYGVQYRIRLAAPRLWFASPAPYTLRHCSEHLEALAARCRFFTIEDLAWTHYGSHHGFPLRLVKVAKPGPDAGRLRVLVIAGEHAAESAGMYACEGLLEELLRTHDLLSDFSFWVVPVVNVDGVAFGRTYHNLDPADPRGPGVNLNRDWQAHSQPENQALWELLQAVRPHCFVDLHNGRHRREFELYALPHPALPTLMTSLRRHLPLPLERWRPAEAAGMSVREVTGAGLAELAVCFETLLLRKAPGCATYVESYRRVGMCLLRGLVEGLREIHHRPHWRIPGAPLATGPLRCESAAFTTQLPAFYYGSGFDTLPAHTMHSLEVNGLPLLPGHYDVWLTMAQSGVNAVCLTLPGRPPSLVRPRDGRLLLTSVAIPGRKLEITFEWSGATTPFGSMVIAQEGLPVDQAMTSAVTWHGYVRDTRLAQRAHLRPAQWPEFRASLMVDGFGRADLEAMHDALADWAVLRQVRDPDSLYRGAIYSEEDKYDARDAAAAAAIFAGRHRASGDRAWCDRALAARQYVYRSQVHEPGNAPRDGGLLHMVHGIWGVDFTRLTPPYPGIDGVDTCVVMHLLCRAVELGLPLGEPDRAALEAAAGWIAANEARPGVFLHHEGARQDCQNMNALALSALVRAYWTLRDNGASPPASWLDAAARGLDHYLQGQEAIGVWPYLFAQVGQRGQAYAPENIPDHGIGLYHLSRVLHRPPVAGATGLHDALKRAARWYLGVACRDGATIDLDYDRRANLGNDICFAGFTWCRFTAAATLLRIARCTDETEPWRHLALRLMEHVRRRRWQTEDRDHAPVVAHARPDAQLATWCQTAEWDAVMLAEMIDDLG